MILAPCSTFGPGKLLCVESLSGSSALLASLCDPPSGSPQKGSERGQLGQVVHPPTPLLRCCLSPPTESGRTAQGGRLSAPLHPHSAAALCFLLLPVYPGISHSVVSNSATPWTAARRAPLSVGFSRQGVGCHFLLQGIIPTQGSNPGLLYCRQILYHLRHQGSPRMATAYLFIDQPSALSQASSCPRYSKHHSGINTLSFPSCQEICGLLRCHGW